MKEVPPEARVPNRAVMNLLEIPVLFYVVCLGVALAGRTDAWALRLAWAYVALRLLHDTRRIPDHSAGV